MLKIVILFVILGILIGVLSTSNINKSDVVIELKNSNKVLVFINMFTLHYFYFFILWLLGFINFGFIFNLFITFFKSFIEGVSLGIIIKTYSLVGIGMFLKNKIFELILILPLLIFISYNSFNYSLGLIKNKYSDKVNLEYLKKLFLMTFIIVIYSICKSLL